MKHSISDDDLCSACQHCDYRPGDLSGCDLDWPAQPDVGRDEIRARVFQGAAK
jgi:hypothetical protein